MRFNDKQKKIICVCLAVALIVPVVISAIAIISGM